MCQNHKKKEICFTHTFKLLRVLIISIPRPAIIRNTCSFGSTYGVRPKVVVLSDKNAAESTNSLSIHRCCLIWGMVYRRVGSNTSILRMRDSQSANRLANVRIVGINKWCSIKKKPTRWHKKWDTESAREDTITQRLNCWPIEWKCTAYQNIKHNAKRLLDLLIKRKKNISINELNPIKDLS